MYRHHLAVLTLAFASACGTAPAPRPIEAQAAPAAVATPPLRAPVDGLSGVVDLSVGAEHACAVLADGSIYCWGNGAEFRLGDGHQAARTRVAERVRGVDPARLVAAGRFMSCALERDGETWCWGGYRRSEDGAPVERGPTLVATPVMGVRGLSVGRFQVTLRDGGNAVSVLDAYVGPVPLDAFAPARETASLSVGFCALGDGGGVECVGNGDEGELGSAGGPGGWGLTPARVLAPQDEAFEPARDEDGNARFMQCADYGDPRPAMCSQYLTGAVDLDAHEGLVCAVLGDGRLACWGCADCYGGPPAPLGLGAGPATSPRIIAGVRDVRRVAVGGRHVCVVTTANVTKCWGDNAEGQLGAAGPASATPLVVEGVGEVVQIDAGDATTCARRVDGSVTCWGRALGTAPPEEALPEDMQAPRWQDLPIRERPVPSDSGARGAHICRDVDVMRRGDPLEQITYRRDAAGHATRVERHVARDDEAYTETTWYGVDRAGNAISKRAQNSVDDSRYTFTYDAQGRLASEHGGGQGDITWTWTRRTAPEGIAAPACPDGCRFEDGLASDGHEVHIERDDSGRERTRRVIDPRHGDAHDHLTSWDASGRVVSEQDVRYVFPFFESRFDREETRYSYDGDGRKISSERWRLIDGAWVPWSRTVHLYSGCLTR